MFGPQPKNIWIIQGQQKAPRQQVWCMDSEAQRRQWASHDAYPTAALSENGVPLNPMVLLIIIPINWL